MWPARGSACTCPAPKTTIQAFTQSDAVVVGRVLRILPVIDGAPALDAKWDVELDVSQWWKGTPKLSLKIRTMAQASRCGRQFELGQDYLIYAREIRGDFRDSRCTRTKLLWEADDDIQRIRAHLAGERVAEEVIVDPHGHAHHEREAVIETLVLDESPHPKATPTRGTIKNPKARSWGNHLTRWPGSAGYCGFPGAFFGGMWGSATWLSRTSSLRPFAQ